MKLTYDADEDILYMIITPEASDGERDSADFNFAVAGRRVEISIGNAQRFVAKAQAALPSTPAPQSEFVWHDADSSMISAFAYDEEKQILEVAFNRTGVYTYYDVPPDVVAGLHRASSKGSYMRNMIIGMYHDEKRSSRRAW